MDTRRAIPIEGVKDPWPPEESIADVPTEGSAWRALDWIGGLIAIAVVIGISAIAMGAIAGGLAELISFGWSLTTGG